MICSACRGDGHDLCAQLRPNPDDPTLILGFERTRCDCQHKRRKDSLFGWKALVSLNPIAPVPVTDGRPIMDADG